MSDPLIRLAPSSIEELSAALKEHFASRNRVQILYTASDPVDPTGGTAITLDKIAAAPVLDRTNGTITFQAGTPVSEILSVLASTLYSADPFTKFNALHPAGVYFTHSRIFGADSLCAMTVAMPDGEVLRFGSKAFLTVAGYNVIDLFLGTRNLLGVPAAYTFKLLPQNHPEDLKSRRFLMDGSHDAIDAEERRILLRLKSRFDPLNILNTFEL